MGLQVCPIPFQKNLTTWLGHFCDVVLLVVVVLFFVEVDQVLVQQLIEQFEIFQTFPDIAVFPYQILSGAVVLQRVLERRLRVVIEDSVLCVSRVLAHLASALLMLLTLQKILVDLQELDLFLEKIEITIPFVFEKIAHLPHVRAVEHTSANYNCALHFFLPKHRPYFASQPLC